MPRPADPAATIAVELRDGTRVEVCVREPKPEPVPGEPPRPECVPREAVWTGDHWHTPIRADNARALLEPEGIAVRAVPEPRPCVSRTVVRNTSAGRHRREPGAASPRTRGSRRESRAGPGDDDPDDESDLAGRRLQLAAAAIVKHSQSSGYTRAVLWALAAHAAQDAGWRCAPGPLALAQGAGCAPATVKDALRRLAALGEIERVGEAERDRSHHGEAIWELTLPELGNPE